MDDRNTFISIAANGVFAILVLLALVAGIVVCVVLRARLGPRTAKLGAAGFGAMLLGRLLSAFLFLALNPLGLASITTISLGGALGGAVELAGVGLLIGALVPQFRQPAPPSFEMTNLGPAPTPAYSGDLPPPSAEPLAAPLPDSSSWPPPGPSPGPLPGRSPGPSPGP